MRLSLTALSAALLAFTAAPAAVAQAPTFGAVCDADPSVAVLIRGETGTATRTIFEYSRDALSLRTAGVINSPINAIALYDGYLYGIPEQTTTLVKAAADGTIIESTPVPGFTFSAPNYYQYFLSGTVDPESGLYYTSSVISDKLYTIDLNNVAAGVSTIDVTLDGAPYNVIPYDLSFYDGHLYGYDQNVQRGVRIDAATGEVSLFPVDGGLPNQYYGSSWVSPSGIFVLSRQNQIFEVDISKPYRWTMTRPLSSTTLANVAEDGTACGVTPPPSFHCNIDPSSAFVTGSPTRKDKLGERVLYRYSMDAETSELEVDSLATIDHPLNAVSVYDDVLYGYHRRDGRLFSVLADGTVTDSVVVTGLPTDKKRAYIAGTIDKDSGVQYVYARGFAKAYAIDLNNVAAGATKVPFLVSGVKTLLDFGDFAYYNGFLYGYDPILKRGFKVDVATGEITLVRILGGVPNKMYPATWVSETGTLFLYKSAKEAYEVDITDDADWRLIEKVESLQDNTVLRAQRDGAHCGLAPSAAPRVPARTQPPIQIVDVRNASEEDTAAPAPVASLSEAAPTRVELGSPYPNPARDRTTLRFALPEAGRATIVVYDVTGREVGTPFDAEAPAGWTEASFDADGLASGTYIVRLRTATGAATGKLVVID